MPGWRSQRRPPARPPAVRDRGGSPPPVRRRRLRAFFAWVLPVATACAAGGGKPDAFEGVKVVRAPVAFAVMHDSPDATVIDLRRQEEYRGPLGHLSGAVNIPLEELDGHLDQLKVIASRVFLVYCRNDPCGIEGARRLRQAGFAHAILIEGGIEGWLAAGYGTVGQKFAPPD